MKPHGVIRDVLDRAVETGVPFVVRRRCTPHQQAAWQAIRFLMDVTERTAFGTREIAHEMGTRAYPRVSGWIADLVELGLLQIVGHEQVKGGKFDRAVYRIPWEQVLEQSSQEAQHYLARLGRRFQDRRPMDPAQLEMDLPVIDRSQEAQGPLPMGNSTVIDRSQRPLPIDHSDCDRSITGPLPMDHGPLPIDHGTVIDGSQEPLPIGNSTVIDRSRWRDGGNHGGREGSRARASRKTLEHLPPDIGPPPPPPDGQPPIAAHPIDLWRDACPEPRAMDLRQLAQLAVAHNEPTGGHGLYWVGRAILAASLAEDVHSIAKVKKILDRWQNTRSYGSDTPAYAHRKADRHERPERTDSTDHRPNGTGRSNGNENRQRGSAAAPRPGSRAYYDQYRERPDGAADGE